MHYLKWSTVPCWALLNLCIQVPKSTRVNPNLSKLTSFSFRKETWLYFTSKLNIGVVGKPFCFFTFRFDSRIPRVVTLISLDHFIVQLFFINRNPKSSCNTYLFQYFYNYISFRLLLHFCYIFHFFKSQVNLLCTH